MPTCPKCLHRFEVKEKKRKGNVRRDIAEARKEKREFMRATLTKGQAKRRYGLTDAELEMLLPLDRYSGPPRYTKASIAILLVRLKKSVPKTKSSGSLF